jgi:4-hydroxymandelate oxidase
MPPTFEQAINLHDLELLARQNLDQNAWEYYSSGADDQITLGENRLAFARLKLRPRFLVDVSSIDTRTSVLGLSLSSPICAAPTAFHGLAHGEAELASARAFQKFGSIFTLSTLSNTPLEGVGQAAGDNFWFQLYVYKDRELTKALVQRAEQSGAKALALTVDAPYFGHRELNERHHFQLPSHLSVSNSGPANDMGPQDANHGSQLAAYARRLLNSRLTWADLEWLRSITPLPIVVKGILTAEDAVLALEHGASGIWVSNHGGRQLDSAVSTLEALPEIVQAVGDRLEVVLDGGVRRGTDVLKALALGARAVFLGRPVLWGLAAGGEAGVTKMLNVLQTELELAMSLSGKVTLADLKPDLIFKPVF